MIFFRVGFFLTHFVTKQNMFTSSIWSKFYEIKIYLLLLYKFDDRDFEISIVRFEEINFLRNIDIYVRYTYMWLRC